MKTSSFTLLVLGIVVGVSLCAVAFSSSIQDFMSGNNMWNGIRDFASDFQVDIIDSLDDLSAASEDGVLVSIPYLEYTPEDLSRLRRYLDHGCTLVLMDDFGYGNGFLQYLGLSARFDQTLLLDPLFCEKNPALPRITDFGEHVRSAGIHSLGLNRAVTLTGIESHQALAWSSASSFRDSNQNGVRDQSEPSGPFVVAAVIPLDSGGTLKLVSDPSLVINSMIGKNDNSRFIAMLTEPTGGSGSLFFDRSHLSRSPLDSSQIGLEKAKEILSHPYSLLGLIAVVFALVTCYTLGKENLFG